MKLAALQIKMQFKTKEDKVEKRQTHDLMDFLGKKIFFGIMVFTICLFINQHLVH